MCMCDKPTVNGQPGYRWNTTEGAPGVYPISAPKLLASETLLFDEPGRCKPQINGKGLTDYHSHHFRLVGARYGEFRLLVKHGSGDERIDLGGAYRRIADIAGLLPDSDARYMFLYALYTMHEEGAAEARNDENEKWRKAAAEKRIKTRKMLKRGTVKVWIEPVNPVQDGAREILKAYADGGTIYST